MARLIQSPDSIADLNGPSVFLAGTIDDGQSIDWQQALIAELHDWDVTLLNPRRAAWDASWVNSITDPQFKAQVAWELAALDAATWIWMYLAPGSLAPISMLELGLYARSGKMIVICPEGFWKKGNVEMLAQHHHIPLYTDVASGLLHLRGLLNMASDVVTPVMASSHEGRRSDGCV